MDITSTLNLPSPGALSPKQRHGQRHSRSSSFSASLLSILSPTSLVSSISNPNPNSRWRSASSTSNTPTSARFPNSNGSSSTSLFGNGTEDIDPEEPLPTYEIQPAMLAVDLSLGPGESRSCAFFSSRPLSWQSAGLLIFSLFRRHLHRQASRQSTSNIQGQVDEVFVRADSWYLPRRILKWRC